MMYMNNKSLDDTFKKHSYLLKKKLYEKGIINESPEVDEGIKDYIAAGSIGLMSLLSPLMADTGVNPRTGANLLTRRYPDVYAGPYALTQSDKDQIQSRQIEMKKLVTELESEIKNYGTRLRTDLMFTYKNKMSDLERKEFRDKLELLHGLVTKHNYTRTEIFDYYDLLRDIGAFEEAKNYFKEYASVSEFLSHIEPKVYKLSISAKQIDDENKISESHLILFMGVFALWLSFGGVLYEIMKKES